VRLSGWVRRDVVNCFFQEYAHQLKALELHNLFQSDEFDPPYPMFVAVQDMVDYMQKHEEDERTALDNQYMMGLLDSYVGNFTALTSLCVATVGNSFTNVWYNTELGDRQYSEWARFIRSVRNTLQSLSFKQGYNRNDHDSPRGIRPPCPHYSYRPMDILFRQWILPVLLEAPWPHVKQMEIRGVGRHVESMVSDHTPTEQELVEPGLQLAFPHEKREELLRLLPEGAKLIVEEGQERDYEELH